MQERYGTTVLLTTHYMEEADALCDRVALMHLGRLRAVGRPDELQAAPTIWADQDSRQVRGPRLLASRVVTLCQVELQKLRHDRTELPTRAVQPVLWLVVLGAAC